MNQGKEVFFVTGNNSKFEEANNILSEFGIKVKQLKLDLEEIQHEDLGKIAENKARQAFEKTGKNKMVFVDDTGLFIKSLKGFPGSNSKLVAKTLGADRLVKLIKGGANKAAFKSVIAVMGPGMSSPEVFEGKCHGKYLIKARGKSADFVPYDRFFVPLGETKTFAQMNLEQKNKYSSRAVSIRNLGKWLSRR